jgi:hypothetical protein
MREWHDCQAAEITWWTSVFYSSDWLSSSGIFAATAPRSQPSKTLPHGAPEDLVEAQLFDLGGGWTSLI